MDEIISLLKDSVDMHVHAKPDLHPRMLTELEILEDAKQFEMRGVISKSHYCMNADRLQIVNNMIENIECFGGVVLNPSVGGINLSAVETAIKFGGKEIWMPSFYSEEHLNNYPAIKELSKNNFHN